MLCGELRPKEIAQEIRQKKQKGKIGTLMGMSASQARLLSITARLTNNELSSQLLTNSKVRLASKSEEASDEYMDALSATKLTYQYYNDNGDAMNYNLTPSVIYSYEPLKSQYSIVDNNGVNLVSAQDAKNFEEADSLGEFLKNYVNAESKETDISKQKYQNWVDTCERLNQEYTEAWNKWNEFPYKVTEDDEVYQMFVGVVGSLEDPDNKPHSCYGNALKGSVACYKHVLAHLLAVNGKDTADETEIFTTSAGKTFNVPSQYITDSAIHSNNLTESMIPIKERIEDETLLCDGDDYYLADGDLTKQNIIQDAIDEGRVPTEKEILKSDFIYDAETNSVTGIKSLRQKAVDLLHLLWNNMLDTTPTEEDPSKTYAELFKTTEAYETLVNFTDGDLRNMALEPIDPPVLTLPDEPDKEYSLVIDDKDKAQWYTNLWYMMNGSESANVVTDDKDETTNGLFVVNGAEKKNQKTANYKVIDDITAKDASWLQYALENGIVSLRQAKYFNPSEDSGKVPELESTGYMWKSVGFKNAIDIKTVEDTEKITRAQAKYEKATREIEAKDNEYDIQLKNLDTIHNALQTEYESVKNVISKNVERSFKAFS